MLFCTVDLDKLIPVVILLVYLFIIICRWIIFLKMDLAPWLSLIPGVREYQIFKKCWMAWPYIVLLALTVVLFSFVQLTGYIDITLPIPPFVKSNLSVLGLVCLFIITILMNKRLAFAFGHDIGYTMGLLFLNPIFIGMLALSKKNVFNEELANLRGKSLKDYLNKNRKLHSRILSTVSAVVIVFTSVGYIGYVMLHEQQPGFLVNSRLNEIYKETSGSVSGHSAVVYPALEEGVIEDGSVRGLYYPDKSNVKETIVYMYIVGSNLEDATGAASINLAQIKDATAAGDNLKFIIEAGGTGRWFTKGFKNRTTARYMIKNGEVTLLETLPDDTSMSKPETLTDFLKWCNDKYPSERKMLFFWDHGAGISGFGHDILVPNEGSPILSMVDITKALKTSGVKYDVIGFDACFMQTMEVGRCLEPYADYLLASEESEPSSGMYYTAAFSRLANEPDLDTLKFGAMMCSSYDQSLKMIFDAPQPGSTMSLVELRYIPVVQELFTGYLDELDSNFKIDKSSFINMSTARSKAYEFAMEDQIDLIDFIDHCSMSSSEKSYMINRIKRAIVVRNAASANHINGLAVYMPYDDLYSYSSVYRDLIKLNMKDETNAYNDFASIIGSQKRTKNDAGKYYQSYDSEDWYVEGFENYDSSVYKQDVSLTKAEKGFKIDLPKEEWDSITGYEQGLKIKVGKRYADLGSDYIYELDDDGHYMLSFNETWVAINGALVALHPGTPKKLDNGKTVYSGTVDATLNFTTPITIYIEWEDTGKHDGEGKVLGYLPANEDSDDFDETGMPRGYKQFKASNIITFLYDWYDEDDNYISTAIGHLPVTVGTYGLKVSQVNIHYEDYKYYGILHDAMHRTIKTKTLHHLAEKPNPDR